MKDYPHTSLKHASHDTTSCSKGLTWPEGHHQVSKSAQNFAQLGTCRGKAYLAGVDVAAEMPAGVVSVEYRKPYVRLNEVLALLPVSASTVWRWVRQGKLSVHKLGPRITVFSRVEIQALFSEVAK